MDTKIAQNTRSQPSIRSFFQPRQPSYTAPPSSTSSKPSPTLPTTSTTHTPPLAPPPASPNPSSIPSTTTPPSSLPTQTNPHIPPQARICPVEQSHILPLRRINALLLPIAYPDSFYHAILAPSSQPSFSRTITWTDPTSQETKIIGGVVCRVDPALSPGSTLQNPQYLEGVHDIYIQSLALLSPYRGKGLAAEVLNEVIDAATRQSDIQIGSLYAHVWTQNEEGLAWYKARGFKTEEYVLNGYYRRLNPDTALIVRRRLVPSDHLHKENQNGLAVQPPATTPVPAMRPPMPNHARSFQERGPEREWNDLPEDVIGGALLKPPSAIGSKEGSAASSRSSSRSGIEARGKKKRVYPAAAFGA